MTESPHDPESAAEPAASPVIENEVLRPDEQELVSVEIDDDDASPQPPQKTAAASPSFGPRRPGPGLPESICWTPFLALLQMGGAIFLFAALIAFQVVELLLAGASGEDILNLLQRLGRRPDQLLNISQFSLMAGVQLLCLPCVLLAARLRIGRNVGAKLSLQPMPLQHVIMLMLLVLPAAMLSGQLHVRLNEVWHAAMDLSPTLQRIRDVLDSQHTAKTIEALSQDASLFSMLLVIAVIPAISEEVIFRGIIGRGLTARWGVCAGVLMTSCLFAVMHIHPVHAAALLPLAVTLHLVYLATRSFFAPVLLHFLNNGLATLALKMPQAQAPAPQVLTDEGAVPLWVLAANIVCVVALCRLMWQTRVEYFLPDGSRWDPGYPTVEAPPGELGAVKRCRPMSQSTLGWTCAAVLLFGASFLTYAYLAQ